MQAAIVCILSLYDEMFGKVECSNGDAKRKVRIQRQEAIDGTNGILNHGMDDIDQTALERHPAVAETPQLLTMISISNTQLQTPKRGENVDISIKTLVQLRAGIRLLIILSLGNSLSYPFISIYLDSFLSCILHTETITRTKRSKPIS